MKLDDPRHGSYAGVLQHYRDHETPCAPCALAGMRATKAAKIRLDNGIRNRIPIGHAAWNVLTVVGCTDVAERTGLTRNNLYRIQRSGPETLVLRSTRDKILSGRPAFTPVGIHRRLRALAALGWTMPEIAALVPCHPEPLTRIVRRVDPPEMVKRHIGLGIVKAYGELHMKRPPASRSGTRQRNRAAARKWAPPLAWDRIDDPNDKPCAGPDRHASHDEVDTVVVQRFFEGEWTIQTTKAEKFAITAEWMARGRSLGELDRVTGWKSDRYVTRTEAVA